MFNWFAAAAPPEPETVVPNLSVADQILSNCESPITLGTLSDRLSLPYQELAPAITNLLAQRKIKTAFLPVGQLNCIHYERRQQRCNT